MCKIYQQIKFLNKKHPLNIYICIKKSQKPNMLELSSCLLEHPFSCTEELNIYLIKKHLINAVSEAVILSTLSYQEAWEMVIFSILGTLVYVYLLAPII
jgi:hypothetical protein